MPIEINELTPYLSVILLKINDQTFDIDSLRSNLTSNTNSFEIVNHTNNGIIYYVYYNEIKKVSWTTNTEIEDSINHILIVYKLDNYLSIYHSDDSKKNKIYKLMYRTPNHEFKKLKVIRKEVLNTAFLNGVKIKNLWLNNIDKLSEIKADFKMLSGSNLEEALDPIGDQTYGYTAVRVERPDFSIGVNTSESKIWIKKFSDGIEYFDMVYILLDLIRTFDNVPNQSLISHPIPILADSHIDYTILNNMIDIQLANIENFSHNSDEYDLLNNIYSFWDDFTFRFSCQNRTYFIDIFDSNLNQINQFELSFSNNNEIVISNIIANANYPDVLNIQPILEHKDLVKFWFEYDYTMIGGLIYKQKYRDVAFGGFKWLNFQNHDVSKEKPTNNNFALIGQAGEDSLFSWIKKYWTGIEPHLVDFTQQVVNGWLLCDDGGNEKADFIHITNEAIPTISLIHAKGANSNSNNRQISTTAYEIVVSQALKNIRYIDKNSISQTIDTAPNINVANLVWHNGQQSTRQNFKNFLDTLPQYKKRVVVLQPHVKQHMYNVNNPSATVKNRLNQLNSLLISAKNTINSLGAEFIVIGEA